MSDNKNLNVNENETQNEETKSKHHGMTIEMNTISEKTKKSFKVRTITAFALLAICVPCLVFGGPFFFGIILVVLAFATYEFIHVLRTKKYPMFVNIFTYIMTISLSFWSYIKNFIMALFRGSTVADAIFSVDYNFLTTDLVISTIGIAILILVLYLFSMLYDDFTVGDVGYLTNTAIIITLGIQSFFFLRFAPMSVK